MTEQPARSLTPDDEPTVGESPPEDIRVSDARPDADTRARPLNVEPPTQHATAATSATPPEADAPAQPVTADTPAEPLEAETPAQPVTAETPAAQPEADRPAQPVTADTPAEPVDEPSTPPAAGESTSSTAPVPTPSELGISTQAAAPTAPSPDPAESDPTEWGRVAEDGTVYVRTAEGERPVGSYPGAEPPEALAYFGRKYDELAGQVGLLEQRVAAGGLSPKDATSTVEHLRAAVAEAKAVGDLASLGTRLDDVAGQIKEMRAQADRERTAARQQAQADKERIVAEAESLAESTDWRATSTRLRALLDEWKTVPRLERKADDALWKRFSRARTAFDKRRRAHFAALDVSRGEAVERKEKLIRKAEELSGSRDWADTAKAYRDLMTQWKAAGRARHDVEESLWSRFRAAQDVFFTARSEEFAKRDAALADNLTKKQALVVEAEAVLPVSDHKAARAVLRSVHERWEAIGHVPRSDRDGIEGRLRRVDDAVRAAEEAEWARSNPEAKARAEATVAQLRTSIAGLEEQAAAARSSGDDRAASQAEEAAATRRTWLTEAERTLAEFS